MLRLIYSDNGTLTDRTKEIESYNQDSFSFDYVSGEDVIYIGSKFPINNLYFAFGDTVNAINANMKVEQWYDTSFKEVVDLIDRTESFKQDGHITFQVNKDYAWYRSDTNYAGETVTGLETLDLYDHYWLKITFDQDLTASIDLRHIGYKFCNDTDIKSRVPWLLTTQLLEKFETGKSDWIDQEILASNDIVKDLKYRDIIKTKGQLLDWNDLTAACVYRTAVIILDNFGESYRDDRNEMEAKYQSYIKKSFPKVDEDFDGREDRDEIGFKKRYLIR